MPLGGGLWSGLVFDAPFFWEPPMGLLKLEAVSLKNSDNVREKWVQEQIAADPSILGLGELALKDAFSPMPAG